jgi:hypothetical protein
LKKQPQPLDRTIIRAADYLKARGVELDQPLSSQLDALKTVDYYDRALSRDVLDFYRGDMGAGEFIDDMIQLVEGQFTRAWNEGMREVGLDPQKDMKPEWEQVLKDEIDAELEHVLDYAQAIEDARIAGDPVAPLQGRIALWTNRYNEIVNLSMRTCEPKMNYRWEFGATEQHCETCAALNGIIASGQDWEASGYHPQGAPNEMLECGGWRCDCRLVPTDDQATEGGIPNV